jgi:hypothetical protein
MNRIILFILLFAKSLLPAHSQQINRYEYWFNQQAQQIMDIAAVQNASLNLNLNTDVLPEGLNSFSIRFRDDNNIWSAALTRFFVKTPVVVGSEQNITMLEYRFNQNELVRQPVSATQQFSFEQSLNAADLPYGLNSFSIRFRDNTGLWSAMFTRFFVKIPVQSTLNAQIVAYEYRFNQDVMVRQNVTAALDISINDVIAAADLPDGLNSFSIRFKDNNGLWSSVLTCFFVKLPVSDHLANNELLNSQIWFNDDFQHVQIMKIESGASFGLLDTLTVADLPNGLNKVQVRFQDSNGLFSSVISRFFVKNPLQNDHETNLMTAYEYWIEDSLGNNLDSDGNTGRNYIALDEPVNPMLLDLNLDMQYIPKGNYHIMFRFLDTRGLWSGVLVRAIEKTLYPVANFGMDEEMFCGTGRVVFSNYSIDTDTWHWDFGDGNESNAFEVDHHFEQEGEFIVTLTATDSASGLQSKTEKVVKIHPVYEFTENHQICEGENFSWHGAEYNTAGEYRKTYQSINGCDSIYVLVLDEYPVYEFTENHQICEGDTYLWHGTMYSQAGTYSHLLKTKAGCDSLQILELTVFEVNDMVDTDGIILTAQAENATYKWFDCQKNEEIAGATGKSFTPTETGSYAVWIGQNGCSVLSGCIEVTITFVNDPYLHSRIYLYPNPAADYINLVLEKDLNNFNVIIMGMNGNLIYSKNNLSGNNYSLPLTGLTQGVYLLEIQHKGYSRRLKFVKGNW